MFTFHLEPLFVIIIKKALTRTSRSQIIQAASPGIMEVLKGDLWAQLIGQIDFIIRFVDPIFSIGSCPCCHGSLLRANSRDANKSTSMYFLLKEYLFTFHLIEMLQNDWDSPFSFRAFHQETYLRVGFLLFDLLPDEIHPIFLCCHHGQSWDYDLYDKDP